LKSLACITLILCMKLLTTSVDASPALRLYLIDPGKASIAEQVLAQTLQGLTATNKDRKIWFKAGGAYEIVFNQMVREGARTQEPASAWDLLKEFRSEVKGAIVFKLGTDSLNVAASLCGPMQAVALDESLLDRAKSEGLPILLDVRGMDEKSAFDKYKNLFKHGTLVNEPIDKPGNLRDLAVARHSFVFGDVGSAFRTRVTRELGPKALVYGWGPSEHGWVKDVSSGNGTGVPADWCLNLSVLQSLQVRIKSPADRPAKAQDGKRYIAFVMSDGDNIQVLCGGFSTDKSFWGSPLRGEFPMTWEMSPILSDVAPRVLQSYYSTATPNDAFVTGPGAPGYTFLHYQADRTAIAKQAAGFLRKSGLNIVSTLNANEGDMSEADSLLDLPGVSAVIYKDYAPYHRRKGEITWHNGKPCIAYKFVLWEGIQGPEDLAREIAKMPASPKTDIASYALINVHAWSYGKSGGPMEAVKRTIDVLPANTEVVTANQLIAMIKANLGKDE
jgi:hypothetical protein